MMIAAKFPWANFKTVVDIGPAQGDLITQVALKNPHLQCVGFDLAEVGPVFEDYVEKNGLTLRVQFRAAASLPIRCPRQK